MVQMLRVPKLEGFNQKSKKPIKMPILYTATPTSYI
nr:unnamed protein product [Callosobruchus analis]